MSPTGTTIPLQQKPKVFALNVRPDPGWMERSMARMSGYDPRSMPQPVRDAIRAGLEETGLLQDTARSQETGLFHDTMQPQNTGLLLHTARTQGTGIRGGYLVTGDIRIHPDRETICIDGVPFRAGNRLINRWKHADRMALVLCTAGEEIGRRAARHRREGDHLGWYCADLIGTLLASAAMNELLRKLEDNAVQRGYSIAGCGFPGNGAWTLTDQPHLFRLFPEGFCGVGITGGGMLSPVASLCGIVGLKRHQNCLFRQADAEPITATAGI